MYGLSRSEVAALRTLSSPDKVQAYLDGLDYNHEAHGDTLRSPRRRSYDAGLHGAPRKEG